MSTNLRTLNLALFALVLTPCASWAQTPTAARPSGTYSDYRSYPADGAVGITAGPNGAIWFTPEVQVAELDRSGSVTAYPVSAEPFSITSASDGALWFTEYEGNQNVRITTAGALTQYAIPTPNSAPF